MLYWQCDVYDNTASNCKKQNVVIEMIQENKRLTYRGVEKKKKRNKKN